MLPEDSVELDIPTSKGPILLPLRPSGLLDTTFFYIHDFFVKASPRCICLYDWGKYARPEYVLSLVGRDKKPKKIFPVQH